MDGIASSLFRDYANSTSEAVQWAIFDGPIDSLWVENMNSVLDENRLLCLGNGERIKLSWRMRVIFEVGELWHSSPSTISRCGIIYFPEDTVNWDSIVRS